MHEVLTSELVTIDVSFISATLLLPRVAEVAPRPELLVLVKPQFEVGRERVGKGGVVRDEADRAAAVARVRAAAEALCFRFRGDVWAMPEGTVAFENEPLVRIHAAQHKKQLGLAVQPRAHAIQHRGHVLAHVGPIPRPGTRTSS